MTDGPPFDSCPTCGQRTSFTCPDRFHRRPIPPDLPDTEPPSMPADVAAALVAMWADLEQVPKGQTADMGWGPKPYRYADLASVYAAVRPVLARHGFAVVQPITRDDDGPVHIDTTLIHSTGWTVVHRFDVSGQGTAQQVGSQITYGRRYALLAALGIAPGEDDDGAAASQPPQHAPRVSQSASLVEQARDLAQRLGYDSEQALAIWSAVAGRDGIETWADLSTPERGRIVAHLRDEYNQQLEDEKNRALQDAYDDA